MSLTKTLSIQSLVSTIVIIFGVSAIIMAIVAGGIFRDDALQSQKETLGRIVKVAVDEVLKKVDDRAVDLGTSTQGESEFRSAIADLSTEENRELVASHLNDQFHQRMVTAGLVELQKLRVYSLDFKLLMESSEGVTGLGEKLPDFLYSQAKDREGADRIKSLGGIWKSNDSTSHYSVLVPIGGLRLIAYLEVVVNPAFNLREVEHTINAPIRLSNVNQEIIFESESWKDRDAKVSLPVPFVLISDEGDDAIIVTMLEDVEALYKSIDHTQWLNIIAFIAMMGGGALFAQIIFKLYLFKPMKRFMEDMDSCAKGDLTVEVNATGLKDLVILGGALKSLVDNLRDQVTRVRQNAEEIASAAEELSVITQESSLGVQRQQSETDQVATAMNEMTATVQEVARHATAAAEAAQNADKESNSGKRVVTEVIEAIDELATEVEKAARVIEELQSESHAIGSVMDVINGIAEQTNLLALNAAIEAARAGEQGRGFAVVADEVRTLASRTQQSTAEIQEMVERLQRGSEAAVKVMSEGRGRAQSGVEKAARAGEALETITQVVTRISDMNSQIASAAEEQAATSNEIDKNVVNITEVANHTAEGARQTAIASERLATLAVDLHALVDQFKVE